MRKKIIDIITDNNFKEVSSTDTGNAAFEFTIGEKDFEAYYEKWKTYEFVDKHPIPTGTILRSLYDPKKKDVFDKIYIYKQERLVFEGEVDNEEEFKILLKMLNIKF